MVVNTTVWSAWMTFTTLLPKAFGAVIVLILGWIAGRAIGRGISKILVKAGVDGVLHKTSMGKTLERSGITVVGFFDLVIRWFIYLVAVVAAVDILEIRILSEFMRSVVEYLPSLIGGVFLFILGFILSDFIGDMIASTGREAEVEFSGLLSLGVRLLLYFVVITLALRVMRIDVEVLLIFARALAWGTALGVGVGLGIAFGWGFKDAVAKNADRWIKSTSQSASKVEEFWEWYTRKTLE